MFQDFMAGYRAKELIYNLLSFKDKKAIEGIIKSEFVRRGELDQFVDIWQRFRESVQRPGNAGDGSLAVKRESP